MARKPPPSAAYQVDRALAELAARLAHGYAAWPERFVDARVYFLVRSGSEELVRSLTFPKERPGLFAGLVPPADPERTPFLLFRLTVPQLYALLGDGPGDVQAEGNEPGLLGAIAACLGGPPAP